MEGFYNFHTIPDVSFAEATTNYHVSIVTDLEAYKTAHGEFRAAQLKTHSH
jgi:hypothetical protein